MTLILAVVKLLPSGRVVLSFGRTVAVDSSKPSLAPVVVAADSMRRLTHQSKSDVYLPWSSVFNTLGNTEWT